MSDMVRLVADRLKRIRLHESTSSKDLTYKDYLEISGAKDNKDSYIKFLTQTKNVQKNDAEEQAKYHYTESIREDDEYEPEYKEEPVRSEKPRFDRTEVMEILKDVLYTAIEETGRTPQVEQRGDKLYYTIDGFRCYSQVVRRGSGFSSLGGFSVYDPEVEYAEDQDDLPYEVDDMLDRISQSLDSAVYSYNKSVETSISTWNLENNK